MIIVTGTKRSGTSMWMQILTAAGLPAFGEAFPRNWGETLKDANPDGFYESVLRRGIYWRTNPHPQTGAYFFPEQVTSHVVKVFIPGLVRTDRAYIGSVIATVRHHREYESSLERLYAMEDEARAQQRKQGKRPVRVPPLLEWWFENYMLLRDIVVRKYRVHVQSYDGLLADPEKVIRQTLEWLGAGDPEPAVQAVKPSNRTQNRDRVGPGRMELEPELEETFELLHSTVHERKPVTKPLLERLNRTHAKLLPRIQEAQRAAAIDAQRRRGATREAKAEPFDEDDVPSW